MQLPLSSRRAASTLLAAALSHVAISPLPPLPSSASDPPPSFTRLARIQFIAALGDPSASSGSGAEGWGLWREDPGPEGVRLSAYKPKLEATGGRAPAGWQFDRNAWWLEEHGLIMPSTKRLPLVSSVREGAQMKVVRPFRRYVVTGDREVTSVLTVHQDGRWELSKGTLYDVTHLPCRSALYTPAAEGSTCLPSKARPSDFPVRPGAESECIPPLWLCGCQQFPLVLAVPRVEGCAKQDYAVLFVVGVEA